MVRTDPARAARAIASELDADLAVGGPDCEKALAGLDNRRRQHQDLEQMSQAMRRAEQVRERTRDEIATRVSAALNTHVAIHPNTLRRAATEYEASMLALQQAIARDGRHRRLANLARAAAAAATVLLAAGLMLAGATVAGAIVAGISSVLVGLWAVGASRDGMTTHHDGLTRHLEVARSRWEQVGGVGTDPRDLEAVIRRYDPQDSLVTDLVGQNPAVRAADRVALQRRMAWVTAWRIEVGDHAPIADPNAAELLQHADAQLWLTGARGLTRSNPQTLVVASPYAELPTDRARDLHHRMLAVPRTFRIIVVLPPDQADVATEHDQVTTTTQWSPGDTPAGLIS